MHHFVKISTLCSTLDSFKSFIRHIVKRPNMFNNAALSLSIALRVDLYAPFEPCWSSQNALNVTKSSSSLSRTASAEAPTKKT
jgi:hypothetical protein